MSQPELSAQLGRMITGYWLSQAVYAAAKLEIADHLAEKGPQTAKQLAEITGTHEESLYRLLRALASCGLFAIDGEDRWQLTPMAEMLRRDTAGSQWALAVMSGEQQYRAWGELLHSVRTGAGAFRHVFGCGIFDFLSEHPEEAAVFDAAMTDVHGREKEPMLAAYDFASIGTLADLGGGNGTVLSGILHAYPAMRGILFDLPHVVERTRPRLAAAGLSDRCELIGGSFFDSVPAGADAYIMRHIIHDWSDELSEKILSNCRQALHPEGRVLVVESVIPPGNEPFFGKLLDLTMLVVPEGKERTAEQYEALFRSAGLRLNRIVPTEHEISILEAVPA